MQINIWQNFAWSVLLYYYGFTLRIMMPLTTLLTLPYQKKRNEVIVLLRALWTSSAKITVWKIIANKKYNEDKLDQILHIYINQQVESSSTGISLAKKRIKEIKELEISQREKEFAVLDDLLSEI